MQNLLKQEQRKIALIVNDMGSVNIDAALLNKNRDRIASVEMVELQNGCICCTLRDEFIAEIERISQLPDIEAVFVEASGISEPSNIAASFVIYTEDNPDTNVYLSSVVSVVDADRIYNEFLREISMENDTEEGDIIINENVELRKDGEEYRVFVYELEWIEPYADLTVEIPDNLVIKDNIDKDTGDPLDEPVTYTVDEFKEMLAAETYPDFATDNVWVSFNVNREIVSVERFYTPAQ
jgi:G3E family GTPase